MHLKEITERYCRRQGITLVQLSQTMDYTRSTFYHILSREDWELGDIKKFAEAMHIKPETLVRKLLK